MSVVTRLEQPGLFIAQRPMLSVLLVLCILGLLGFSGGGLVSESVRADVPERLGDFVALAGFVAIFNFLPAVVPERKWARILLSAGIVAAGSLVAFLGWSARGPEDANLPVSAILYTSFAVSLLVLIQPFVGRGFLLSAVVSPFTGLIGVSAITGFLIRHEVAATETVMIAQTLAFAIGVLAGTYFSATLSRVSQTRAIGARLVSGLTFNRLLHDIIFWSLASGVFTVFYLRETLAAAAGLSLGTMGLLIVPLTAIPVVVIAASAASVWTPLDSIARSRTWADHNAVKLSVSILSRMTPSSLNAFFVIAIILAVAVFAETPLSMFTETGQDANIHASIFLRVIFYVLIFAITSAVYLSFRMATLVTITLLLSDILTAGMLNVIMSGQGSAIRLIDIAPRLIVLLMIVRVARNWSDILHNRQIAKRQITLAFARSAAPAVAGVLFCVLVFSGLSILVPTLSVSADYMATRLTIQAALAFVLMPAAMSVIAKLKFSF